MPAPNTVHAGAQSAAGTLSAAARRDPDPIATEILRHALKSAARQMYIALVRTSVSPLIYATVDFSIAIFDARLRLLAQSPGMTLFLGSMSFTLEAAVRHAGGAESLERGDILLLNLPHETGTHPNDVGLIMPVFDEAQQILAYTALKFHLSDVAGKAPYITDSTDVYQEGVLYPGLKLYKAGKPDPELHRLLLTNTRVPKQVAGDVAAGAAALNTGAAEMLRLMKRFGRAKFEETLERMLDYSEAQMRAFIEHLPDGRYVAQGQIDNDGVSDAPIALAAAVEVKGSQLCVDFTDGAGAVEGPYNCPLPLTVSACRVAVAMLAGRGEMPNEGHFRPIAVRTRPGSLHEPEASAPTFLGFWTGLQVIDMIHAAIAQAAPDSVPAGSGGDVCGTMFWGRREQTGEPWCAGLPFPVGQGGSRRADGTSFNHIGAGAQRLAPVEEWDRQNPMLTECLELVPDSCGAGTYRGGMGIRVVFRAREAAFATATIERTRFPGGGLRGGLCAMPNKLTVYFPDGTRDTRNKFTSLKIPKGTRVETVTGGGGGYGPPGERSDAALLEDLRGGYVSEQHLKAHYPQAQRILEQLTALPSSTSQE
jgi:N-methylhydantoinase B